MSNKSWEAMRIALDNLSPNTKSIVLTSDGLLSDDVMTTYVLSDNFEVEDVISAIGDIKLVGIIYLDTLNEVSIIELIKILISKNKTTVVRVNANPISYKVLYPIPAIGTHSW